MDTTLLKTLQEFQYPKEFEEFIPIINEISKSNLYQNDSLTIEIYNGDAREYLLELHQREIKLDIVYQDPFSSDVNKFLWSKEYFRDLEKLLNNDGIITTYSIATPVRLSLYENSFYIYEIEPERKRKSTIALKNYLPQQYKYIDMELKKQRSPKQKPILDSD